MSCRPEVHDTYVKEREEGNARMAWGVAEVPSWYRNAHGRVTQNWPYDLLAFWQRTRHPDLSDYVLEA
jgi:4-hydroxyacetophenone monooxygenase